MSDLMDLPTEQPTAAPTLGERVRKVLEGSNKALPFAKVKSAINPKGTAKAEKVSDADILRELEAEGIHVHPAKADGGKPSYWHSKYVSAEEKAAEKAAAKAAEIERKKVAKAEDAAEKARLKEETIAAAAKAKADKAEAVAKAKAEKEAEAVRKKVASVVDALLKKVDELGDAPVALKKPTAAAGIEAAEAFEKTLKQLIGDGKIFAHPGSKYGRKAPEPPTPWHQKSATKKKLDALVASLEKILQIEGATADGVLEILKQRLGAAKAVVPPVTPPPTTFDLADFARKVNEIARHAPKEDRFHDKVFISAAWSRSQTEPAFPKMGLPEFKKHLVEANIKQLVRLGRANEVQLMNPTLVEASETYQEPTTFHFILV